MSARSRRLLLTLPVAVLTAACASTGTPSPSRDTSPPATEPAPSVASRQAGQTDTDWGRIWDSLPSGFPQFPGSTPADDATPQPASGRFAVEGGDPEAIATWFQDALEGAMFSTVGLNGPGEDGGFVIDSVGDGDCRIQTTIVPQGGTMFIAILYGAGCPAG